MSVQCRSCGQGLALLDDVCLYFNVTRLWESIIAMVLILQLFY